MSGKGEVHIIEKVLVGSREDESMVSKKTVAVIFGGQSSEHEVSRTSAVMMLQALDKEKYLIHQRRTRKSILTVCSKHDVIGHTHAIRNKVLQ